MPPKQNPLVARLNEIFALLQAGTISEAEHSVLRCQALGLPPPAPPAAQVVQAVVEDSASKAERDVKAMTEALIGTMQRPFLGGEAWLVFVGKSGTGILRDEVVRLCSTSPSRRAFSALFRQAGQGVTPPCLLGDTPTHVFARHGAREFLRRVGLAVCLSLMLLQQPNLEKEGARRMLERVVDQDDNTRLANGLLTSVSKMRSAEETLVRKTGKDSAASAEADAVCKNCGLRGHYARNCPKKDTVGGANDQAKQDGRRPRADAQQDQPPASRRRRGQ